MVAESRQHIMRRNIATRLQQKIRIRKSESVLAFTEHVIGLMTASIARGRQEVHKEMGGRFGGR